MTDIHWSNKNGVQFESLKDLAEALHGTAWKRGTKARIYFNGHGKDISAYLEFDPGSQIRPQVIDGVIVGASLKVFTNCHQSQQWRINRCKQVKHTIMLRLQAIIGGEVCESWQNVIL